MCNTRHFWKWSNQQAPGWALSLRDLEALLLWHCALMKRLWGLKLCLQVGVWVEVVRLCPAEGWGCYCSRLWGSQTGGILWGGGRPTPVTSLSSQHRICCPPSVWATRHPKRSPTPFRASINASPAHLNTNPVWKYLCNVTGLVRCASHVMLGRDGAEEMRTSRSLFALTPLHSLRVIARKMDALLKLWNTSGRFYGVTPTSALTLIWQ